jgi:plastocyanin
MRRLIFAFATVLALGGGVALAQYGTPMEVPTASPTAPAPAASPVSVVHIKNFAFVPDKVTITAGQSVRWVQDDDAPHTVTASDKSFDSGNLDKKAAWTHKFDKAGTYAYICAYHTYMRGTVVVNAP